MLRYFYMLSSLLIYRLITRVVEFKYLSWYVIFRINGYFSLKIDIFLSLITFFLITSLTLFKMDGWIIFVHIPCTNWSVSLSFMLQKYKIMVLKNKRIGIFMISINFISWFMTCFLLNPLQSGPLPHLNRSGGGGVDR